MRIGVGLSIPELATRGGRFSPASLFTSGVVGAWYDPSDTSTLFQDSAGTTPVTAVEQGVRLMLDKSQGGLGSELVTNGGFSSSSNWTLSSTTITGGNLVFGVAFGYASQAISGTAGTYKLLVNKSVGFAGAGNLTFAFYNAGSIVGSAISIGSTTLTFGSGIITASGSFDEIRIVCSTTDAYQVDSVSVARAPGNHALAPNDPSRPILRARYNLLTYSEQFDNAAWTKSSVTLTNNATTAPDGTTTAEKVLATAGNARHAVYTGATSASGTCVASVYVKYDNHAFFQIGGSSGGFYANFNISTGVVGTSGGARYISHAITNVGSGWYRLSVTYTNSSDGPWLQQVSSASDGLLPFWTAAGTESTFIWGAQVDNASSIGTYQRIAAATDYATAGFLPYLYFVTDDSFGTNSIDFSATDKMSVCAGITKLSDAATGILVELSADWATNNGSFVTGAPNSTGVSGDYTAGSKGIAVTNANQVAFSAVSLAPITNVYAATHDIAGDLSAIRLNGAASGTNGTGDKGAGNFGNYPLFIGRRNNATFPFNGNLYQLIVCGKALSASELASTEAYVATKTGVTI